MGIRIEMSVARLLLTISLFVFGGADADFAVYAYLPEWRYDGANYADICQVVTHLIFFSIEVTPEGNLAALDRLPRKALREEARSHCSKLLICIGGNGRSAGFAQ